MQEKNRDFSVIKKRIIQYLDIKGISKYEFYQKTKISNGILSQKGGLTEDNILKILSYYKDINANWLLTGEGPMLRETTEYNNGPPAQIPVKPKQEYNTCPLCKEKDKVIAAQEKTIALLEDQLRECKQSRAKEGEPAQPIHGPELAQLK
jgi:hypothetical protein